MIERGIELFDQYPYAVAPAFFAFVVLRFVVFSGGAYWLLWNVLPETLQRRKIQSGRPFRNQIASETRHSVIGYLTWAAIAQAVWFVYRAGYTKIYLDLNERNLAWVPFGIVFGMILHDAYFYWLHRWLHTRWAFKKVHYIHHKSKAPTPFAAHSFHWLEAFLNGLYILPIVMLVPMHYGTLFAFALLTHFFSTWGHFNYGLMPYRTWFKWWGSWVTTSSHHNHHHVYVNKNFGLYIKYWDKWFGTLAEETHAYFVEKNRLAPPTSHDQSPARIEPETRIARNG